MNTGVITVDRNWQEIATGEQSGFISNEGNAVVYVCQFTSSSEPIENIGHSLKPRNDIGIYFNVDAGESVYAKTAPSNSNDSGKIAITVG